METEREEETEKEIEGRGRLDPEQSWLRATQAIKDTADQAAQQLQQGVPLRPKLIEGGRDGVRYGFDALIAKYRRPI